jgi:hypothetical protein
MRRDPEELKRVRENSAEETQKWLAYAMQMVETMVQYALKHDGPAWNNVVQPYRGFLHPRNRI